MTDRIDYTPLLKNVHKWPREIHTKLKNKSWRLTHEITHITILADTGKESE